MSEQQPGTAEPEAEQPFIAHLIELRDRLLRSVLVVALIFASLFHFSNELYHLLAKPLLAHMPKGGTMIATEVASSFIIPLKLTLVLSVFIAIPYLLYQLWSFIAPGLYRHEKRLALPLLVSSVLLFYCGMAFAYFVIFPVAFGFFTSVAPQGVAVMTDIGKYLDFVLKLFFAFGLAFEVPVATIIMVAAGITTPEALAAKRPYIVVAVFVLGAVLTPPDVFSQVLLAVPMLLLFESGLWMSRLMLRRKQEAAEAASAAEQDAVADGEEGEPEEDYQPLDEDQMEAELDRAEEDERKVTGEPEGGRPSGD